MSEQKPSEWMSALISRFDDQLPYRTGPVNSLTSVNIAHNKLSLVRLCQLGFSQVLVSLTKCLQKIDESLSAQTHSADIERSFYESLLIVLDTVHTCLCVQQPQQQQQQQDEGCVWRGVNVDEHANCVKQLLRSVSQFINLSSENTLVVQLKVLSCKVLATLSETNFNIVFGKFSCRLNQLSVCGVDECIDLSDLEVIEYMSFDTGRVVKLLTEVNTKIRTINKHAHTQLLRSIERSLCSWLERRPTQLAELQISPGINEELTRQSDVLFDFLDQLNDKNKRRCSVWPLQILLLSLSQEVVDDIMHAETGGQCTAAHVKKKQFVDSLRKHLNSSTNNKSANEAAAMACVNLCQAGSYVKQSRANSAMFRLAQTVVSDLKALLFSIVKPFSRGVSQQSADIELLCDAFVAIFRVSPALIPDMVDACLSSGPLSSSSSTPVYMFVLANSLCRIISHPRVDGWPGIDVVYPFSERLRHMFLDILNKVNQTSAPVSHVTLKMIQNLNANLKEKVNPSRLRERSCEDTLLCRTLVCMVQLIRADPLLMMSGTCGIEKQCSTLELINGLVSVVHSSSWPVADVPSQAMKALLVLHRPEHIENWNPEAVMNTFWDVSSQVLYSTAQKLIQHQLGYYGAVLAWLRQLLVCRNTFLARHRDHANIGSGQRICRQAHIKLECVLFMYLWSVDMDAVLTTMSCFSLICHEADIRCASEEVRVTQLLPNYSVYQQLTAASQQLTTGRAALQKRIMSLLTRIEHCTQGCLAAWQDTYNKWSHATRAYCHAGGRAGAAAGGGVAGGGGARADDVPPSELCRSSSKRRSSHQCTEHELEQEQINEWTNMTGFLVSLGGVTLLPPADSALSSCSAGGVRTVAGGSSSSSLSPSTVGAAAIVPASAQPAVAAVALISGGGGAGSTCDDLSDAVRRMHALSSGGHSVQYCPVPQFIGQLLALLVCCHEKHGTSIQKNVKDLISHRMSPLMYPSLFDQIKIVLEKWFDPQGQVIVSASSTLFAEHVIFIMKTVLDNTLEQCGEYLGVSCIDTMIVHLVRYVRHLDVSTHALHTRTKLCHLIVSMMRRRDCLAFRQEMRFRNKMVEYLVDWVMTDSHHAAVSAELTILSRTLDHACMEAVASLLRDLPLQAEESDRGDVMDAKSDLFSKYLTLFLNLLNDTKSAEDKDTDTQESVMRDACALRSATIEAMSNMLAANIDSGLSYSLPLGYSHDVHTRAAVIEVLTKILQQGTEFSMLAETVLADRFEQLVQLVTMIGDRGELPIAMALASVVTFNQMDELARVFVAVFEAHHLLPQLLWNMFYKEVELSDCMQTLLRGNSLSSKIMAVCFKTYGTSYLRALLEPLIKECMEDETKRYEVDPSRACSQDNLAENRRNLTYLAQRVFNSITSSADQFPPQLRIMCNFLYQVLSKQFSQLPENNIGAVGTVIFLRFINPAIVAPFEMNIVEKPPGGHVRRALTLVSKILQNIANHVEFSKEQHMTAFNDFLRANFDTARGFFVQISSDCETAQCSSQQTASFISDTNVLSLHRLLWTHQEKIGEYLSSSRDHKVVGRRPFDKMATLLAYLGPPEHKPLDSHGWSDIDVMSTMFEAVMSKHNMHEKDDFKCIKNSSIFYQAGTSRLGHPVFYYIARRYRIGETNGDLMIYHVILTLKPYYRKPFELVIDFTQVNSENRFRTEFLQKWFVVLPSSVTENIHTVYIYNANSWIREYTKFHDRILSPLKGNKKVVMVDSASRLNDFIEPVELKLPATTLSLEGDLRVFSNALKLSHKDTRVIIKVGASAVQVTSVEKLRVLSQPVQLNDVYHVSELEHVFLVDDQQFTLAIANEPGALNFIHSDCETIVAAIQHIRKRFEMSQPLSSPVHQKVRAKDVPGRLLNMALLNLGSHDPGLRKVAYNLLCAVAKHFDLKIEGQLLETAGLCIPSNNSAFIKCVSENLAQNESHLTLEFVADCIHGFHGSSMAHKHLCLEYMTPWLPNLTKFCKNTDDSTKRLVEDTKRQKVAAILERLITLTVQEVDIYPSIQTSVWGSIGQVPELIDMVLDAFIQRSVTGGLNSIQALVMADTTVALVSHNIQLVSNRVIGRLCSTLVKTCTSPSCRLEDHISWTEIAVLTSYLLTMSFNNRLAVTQHLPYLFHVITMLAGTGAASVRASVHGLLINIVHSLCTGTQPQFSEETRRVLLLSLDEFSLPKFYRLFDVQHDGGDETSVFTCRVHQRSSGSLSRSSSTRHADKSCTISSSTAAAGVSTTGASGGGVGVGGTGVTDHEPLHSLETITDALLEIMDVCQREVAHSDWLAVWLHLAKNIAFSFNPALQPRALVVFGCISGVAVARGGGVTVLCERCVVGADIKHMLHVLVKALERVVDLPLVEAVVSCLARVQPQLASTSPIHCWLFWVAISVLQLDVVSLYAAGLALLEQNLHTLDQQGYFDHESVENVLMSAREPLEWYFKMLDHSVGLNFKGNFHFALVGHLLKGFRHPYSAVVSRTIRILNMLLVIVAKPGGRDKFQVGADNIAYLAALVSVSEEVRSRCRLVHQPRDHVLCARACRPPASEELSVEMHECATSRQHVDEVLACCDASTDTATLPLTDQTISTAAAGDEFCCMSGVLGTVPSLHHHAVADSSSRTPHPHCLLPSVYQSSGGLLAPGSSQECAVMQFVDVSHATTTTNNTNTNNNNNSGGGSVCAGGPLWNTTVLQDTNTQLLTITLLASLVKHTSDSTETRILYQYLADAALIIPRVFSSIYILLDARLSQVLCHCYDRHVLQAVQCIIESMLLLADEQHETPASPHCPPQSPHQTLHHSAVQSCGFGGLWRFAAPFPETSSASLNAEQFRNCLEAMVDTCWSVSDQSCQQVGVTLCLPNTTVSSAAEPNNPHCF